LIIGVPARVEDARPGRGIERSQAARHVVEGEEASEVERERVVSVARERQRRAPSHQPVGGALRVEVASAM
jgi:hypothetical protein